MELNVERLSESKFTSLEEEWNALLSRSASDTFFLRWEWIHTWWTHFHKKRTLWILTAREHDRLIGIAPFYIQSPNPWGARMLRICSDDLGPDYLDVIIERGREREVLSAFWTSLSRRPALWDVIAFESVRTDAVLLSNASSLGRYAQVLQHAHVCPYIEIQGSFDAFFKSHHSLKRFALHKKERVLFDDLGVTFQRMQNMKDWEKGLEDLFELHRLRAGARHLDSNFMSPAVKRFHQELGRQLLPRGLVELHALYRGPRPVAAHYHFSYNHKMYFYQSGYDPDWSRWSVGMVLLRQTVKAAFENGVTEFDFLKGDESYKQLWASATREERFWRVFNRTTWGTLHHWAHRAHGWQRQATRFMTSSLGKAELPSIDLRQAQPVTLENCTSTSSHRPRFAAANRDVHPGS